jgi:ABC-type multidrug transport system fused ATPase/permease subunit
MADSPRKKLSISGLKQTLRLLSYIKPYRFKFGLGLFLLLLSSGANLAFPKLLGDLVNAAQSVDFSKTINQVAGWLMLVLIAQAVVSFFRVVLFVEVTEKALAQLRQDTYNHIIALPMAFFAQARVGELNSRISSDITQLQDTFTSTLAEFIRQIIIIVGGIALLGMTSWKLTLFMLVTLPPVIVVAILFGKYIRTYGKKVQQSVAESNTIVEETLQGIATVKSFANEPYERNRYQQRVLEVAAIAVKGGWYRAAFASFIILGLFGVVVAVIWQGTRLIASGEIDAGQLFSFVLYSGFIGGSIGGLADVYARLQKAVGATEDLFGLLDQATETTAQKGQLRVQSGTLAFDQVAFAYPSRPDTPVLKNIQFELKPGQKLALVGKSGAGKSTLTQLLFRFYAPTSGTITLNGTDIQEYDLSDWRNHLAIVPQDVLLFGGSIGENIRYGKPDATEEEVKWAAQQAHAWEFIVRFPDQLQTVVGERGIQLSGGQRQRIAIARAILKNPKLLILDEATSNLDANSEFQVQQALETLMQGRTSLVIAHRLSTVRSADLILLLHEGAIVEAGSYEALMAKPNGLFADLARLQLK